MTYSSKKYKKTLHLINPYSNRINTLHLQNMKPQSQEDSWLHSCPEEDHQHLPQAEFTLAGIYLLLVSFNFSCIRNVISQNDKLGNSQGKMTAYHVSIY